MFSEAISSFESHFFWKYAIKTELDSITQNNTWTLVDLPPGAEPIASCKRVYTKGKNQLF